MLSTLDLDATKDFLKICQKEITKGNCYFVGDRVSNINGNKVSAKQALVDIGIMSIKQIWKYVLMLNQKIV